MAASPTPVRRFTRRRMLSWGLGGLGAIAAGGVAGLELVLHDVLPGHDALNRLDGACNVPGPAQKFLPTGPATSGTFVSRARGRQVGYTIAYPPGHGASAPLPLVVMLHGLGRDHNRALSGISLQQALALELDGRPIPPMAMVAADGGGGYWHAHPGDDPMGMVVDELIPMCRDLGLGGPPSGWVSWGSRWAPTVASCLPSVTLGWSPPWPPSARRCRSWAEARAANAGAFVSAADFAANDVIDNAAALESTPVPIASGRDDPFHPGVRALIAALPPGVVVSISKGCHTDAYWASEQPAALTFLAAHLG